MQTASLVVSVEAMQIRTSLGRNYISAEIDNSEAVEAVVALNEEPWV